MSLFRLSQVGGISRTVFARLPLFAAAIWLISQAISLLGCSGNTTGVDNPGLSELPVRFRDDAGTLAMVHGELEIYGKEQNPALYPEPLLRMQVQNSSIARITAEDFQRIEAEAARLHSAQMSKRAANLSAPAQPIFAAGDSLLFFNVIFRGDSQSGALASGLAYDAVHRIFFLEGGSSQGQVNMQPQPMKAYSAQLQRDASVGDLGRVYIPGTPFQSTLVNEAFSFSSLPVGHFSLRLLNAEGFIFAVRESLYTEQSRIFTAAPEPIGKVDSAYPSVSFQMTAGADQGISVSDTATLLGGVSGVNPADARLSLLWRRLKPLPGDSVWMENPTRLNTRIHFQKPGSYVLELVVSLAAQTLRDTVIWTVQADPSTPTPRFLFPLIKDTLVMGSSGYKIVWESPWIGLARLEYSLQGGSANSWELIADSIPTVKGTSTYFWPPPIVGTQFLKTMLRLMPLDSASTQITTDFLLAPP